MSDNNTEILLKLKAIDELTPVMIKAVQAMDAQTSALTASMEKLGSATQAPKEHAEGLNTGMVNLASTMHVVGEAVEIAHKAWEAIEGTIEKAIEEAEEAVKAENRLTGALVANGKYTRENVDAIEEYAESVKKATGVQDEQVKIMVAQGIQMGLSVQKSKELELAARQLAAATGKDVNEAFSLLQGSLAGQSRGLAKILPQIKDLTQAQLKSGEAADLVSKAFGAQYELYEKSYSVAVKKAETAVADVYKALGQMIIQSPIVIKAIQAFAEGAKSFAGALEQTHAWVVKNGAVLLNYGEALVKATAAVGLLYAAIKTIQFGSAVFEALAISIKLYGVAQTLVTNGTLLMTTAMNGLKIAMATINPFYAIAVVAVAALTAAFVKWPGLIDIVVGSLKQFAGMFVEAMADILGVAAKVAGVFNNDLANSIKRAQSSMQGYADKLQLAGVQQADLGRETNATKDMTLKATDATDEHTKALDANSVKASEAAAAHKKLIESYAGIAIGTKASRDALEAETQQRDQDLKKFNDYLEAKKRTAVSKAEEQQIQLANVRAKEVGGSGGEESGKAKIDASIANEVKHQADLRALRQAGVLTQKQFDEEYQESAQNMRTLGLQREQAHQQALADVYANSPAGYQARQAQDKADFEIKLANQSEQLTRLGQNEAQVAEFQRVQRAQFNQSQYDAQKAHDAQMIQLATETQRMKLEAMGDTPEAMQAKQALEEQTYQLELATKMQRAQEQGLTDLQIQQMKEQAELDHKNRLQEISVQYYEGEATRQEKANNDWEAFNARRQASVAQHGVIMGNMQAIQNSQYFKAEMGMLNDLSSLRSSKNKKQFEVGKAAAIATATVQTFLGATQAFTSLSSIPIVGPVLGAIAAAAAIASGMNQISQIKAQQFNGGQADSGMDSIPQHLDGKSFVLSGGERVVQPTANKELTDFLAREKNGNTSSGGINITLNYSGSGSKEDAKKMADIVIQEIRSRSERGTPVISSKGVTS